MAQARLEDARVLAANGRWDGARYICGYALEIALKSRITQTLSWAEYPETPAEFREYQSFKTHNLDTLLSLSGREQLIKANASSFADWSIVNKWNPEARYKVVGSFSKQDATDFIDSTSRLVAAL